MLTIFISQLNTPLYSCLVRLAWRRKYIQKYSRDQTVCRCRVLLQTSKPYSTSNVSPVAINRTPKPASGMLHHFAATPPFLTQQLGPNTIVDLETQIRPGYRHGKRQINSWRIALQLDFLQISLEQRRGIQIEAAATSNNSVFSISINLSV
ncbi:Hypothetical_protein [Hexamita inflata]|uniref:Hypothetical_protein n=1 Tax=Hexamita inflata TaxID=28002 RepID=A0AA86UMN4_9EUKA|nr:Hypothetical protein HINF_LOCUS45043 [Hexamita inflata]CAI9957400.1 Hypothetical protein HINF_LOCUS45045 [Hexamita inflata]CAI9957401.1 Hypothetical protein HINF_LOCUS45046 [Hexamita inflata]CAI9957402.1 Hypothetical protein HINF_LOCUS45047 [Hexamita inflata]